MLQWLYHVISCTGCPTAHVTPILGDERGSGTGKMGSMTSSKMKPGQYAPSQSDRALAGDRVATVAASVPRTDSSLPMDALRAGAGRRGTGTNWHRIPDPFSLHYFQLHSSLRYHLHIFSQETPIQIKIYISV